NGLFGGLHWFSLRAGMSLGRLCARLPRASMGSIPYSRCRLVMAPGLLIAREVEQCGGRRFGAAPQTELHQDAAHMVTGGLGGDEQSFRDLAVRETFGHQPQHFLLPPAQDSYVAGACPALDAELTEERRSP